MNLFEEFEETENSEQMSMDIEKKEWISVGYHRYQVSITFHCKPEITLELIPCCIEANRWIPKESDKVIFNKIEQTNILYTLSAWRVPFLDNMIKYNYDGISPPNYSHYVDRIGDHEGLKDGKTQDNHFSAIVWNEKGFESVYVKMEKHMPLFVYESNKKM